METEFSVTEMESEQSPLGTFPGLFQTSKVYSGIGWKKVRSRNLCVVNFP